MTFERYDLPGMNMDGDIATGGGTKAAWFKDPDGDHPRSHPAAELNRAAKPTGHQPTEHETEVGTHGPANRINPPKRRSARTMRVLLLVDQQEGLFSRIHEAEQTRRNLLALARAARLLGIPAVLTTALADGPNGPQLRELTDEQEA